MRSSQLLCLRSLRTITHSSSNVCPHPPCSVYCSDVVLEKHYQSFTSRSSVELFTEQALKTAKRDDVPPIITTAKYHLVNIYRNGLYILATVTGEVGRWEWQGVRVGQLGARRAFILRTPVWWGSGLRLSTRETTTLLNAAASRRSLSSRSVAVAEVPPRYSPARSRLCSCCRCPLCLCSSFCTACLTFSRTTLAT